MKSIASGFAPKKILAIGFLFLTLIPSRIFFATELSKELISSYVGFPVISISFSI